VFWLAARIPDIHLVTTDNGHFHRFSADQVIQRAIWRTAIVYFVVIDAIDICGNASFQRIYVV
jgi:predicted O-methyltransferase YrrM